MKSAAPGSCPLCAGDRAPGETTFSAELGTGLLVVRHVPAIVCRQCGAHWFNDDVAAQLEQRAAEARRNHAELEVVAFA